MRKVFMHGEMGEKFGRELVLHVDSVPECVRLLEANYPGEFMPYLYDRKFHVLVGKDIETAMSLSDETLPLQLGKKDIHFLPYVEGGGGGKNGKGIFTVVLGVALIATGVGGALGAFGAAANGFGTTAISFGSLGGITFGNIAMFGASLVLQGASTLLSHPPKSSGLTGANTNASFLFNGAINNVQEGGPVPLLYGRFMAGSTVVSGGISFVQIPAS
jgi:predicted phage tail protein